MQKGTKADLREDPETLKKLEERKQKLITVEMGEEMAKEIGAFKYFDTSSLTQQVKKNQNFLTFILK